MKQDTYKTKVVFLLEYNLEIFAFFPATPEGNGLYMCYDSVGQHSKSTLMYARECQPATPEQYEPLKRELEGLGYNLEVTNL